MSRLDDVKRFYDLLSALEERSGGKRTLAASNARLGWPQRGVYFFFERGEERSTSGTGPRVVRVGTHAVSAGSKTTLWNRLSNHKGTANGGNHRGSIFRLHVGTALIARGGWDEVAATWGRGQSVKADVRDAERALERRVSEVIGAMGLLVLDVDDTPSKDSLRGYLERNAIALLSNAASADEIDAASEAWLGRHANREAVRRSGLWNVNHVNEPYDPAFLDVLEEHVSERLK